MLNRLDRSDLKIDTVESFLVDLPTIRPHRLAMATMSRQTLMLVRVRFSDGGVGLGEATTIGGLAYGEESPEGMKLTVDRYISAILTGERFTSVPALMDGVARSVAGNRFAKCAVETALLDGWARRLDVPMSELLGGRRRDRLPVAWTLASGDTAKDIDEAERMLAKRRHRIFKVKIGRRPLAEDLVHVEAITKAIGDRGEVRVDVNMAWDEAMASRGVAALQAMGCTLVEQPTAARRQTMKRLAARFDVPLMADEALQGPDVAFELAAEAAADVFAVKIAQSGGLFAAARVAAIAEAAGIGVYGGTMLEGSPGTAASAQLFSTFARLEWGTELFGPLLLNEDIVATPLAYDNFELAVPSGPGLGVEIDEDRLAFFRRDPGT